MPAEPAELERTAGPGSDSVSVTEFTRRVKRLLEGGVPPCWVRGEVSNLRAQSSGHLYFSLKDAGAQLPAVMFRADAGRQTVRMRDGLQVVAYGSLSVYEPHGKYQLIVRALVEDGIGRLQREFEALKLRLRRRGFLIRPGRSRSPRCRLRSDSSLRRRRGRAGFPKDPDPAGLAGAGGDPAGQGAGHGRGGRNGGAADARARAGDL